MRGRLALVLALVTAPCAGCSELIGLQDSTPFPDVGLSDGAADGELDGTLADARDAEPDTTEDAPPADTADAATCVPAGNLVPDGDFAGGFASWVVEKAQLEWIDGPCGGKAVRVYGASSYGAISRWFGSSLAKGTKLHLRAWFKASGVGGAQLPALSCVGVGTDDAGIETRTEAFAVFGTRGPTWELAETTFTLPSDVNGFGVVISSRNPDADEFAVGAVSLVVE